MPTHALVSRVGPELRRVVVVGDGHQLPGRPGVGTRRVEQVEVLPDALGVDGEAPDVEAVRVATPQIRRRPLKISYGGSHRRELLLQGHRHLPPRAIARLTAIGSRRESALPDSRTEE